LHSQISPGHPELESYARNVGVEIEKEGLEGIIVKESPRRVYTRELLRKYRAEWLFNLHSDVTEPYWVKIEEKWVRALPYSYVKKRKGRIPRKYEIPPPDYSDLIEKLYPVARVVYGGVAPEDEWYKPIGNRVGVLLNEFQKEKYGAEFAIKLSCAYPPSRLHERRLTFGLLFVRPLNQSVELVKSLAQYLQRRSLKDITFG